MTTPDPPARVLQEPSVPRRRVWVFSFLALSILGVAWVVMVPLGGQPDEPAHVAKAAAVVRGEFTWDARTDHVSTSPDELTISEIELEVPRGYGDLLTQSLCLAPGEPASCAPPVLDDDTPALARSTYAAAYPPVPYLLMGWPSLFLPTGRGIYAMRLCMVVVCSALLATACTVARSCRNGRYVALGVALASTPMVLFLAANPNPNGLEVAASICFSVGLLALLAGSTPWAQHDRLSLGATTASGVALVLARPVSVAVLVLSWFVVLVAFGRIDRVRALLRWRAVWACGAAVGVAVVGALWWLFFARPLDAVVGIPHPDPDFWANMRYSLGRLPDRAEEMVGVFSWGTIWPPVWVVWGWLALIGSLVVTALVVGSWRHRVALVGLVVGMCILPTAAELPRVQELGFIWQGRYSLAFAVTVPLLAGGIIVAARSDGQRSVPDLPRWAVAAVAVFAVASLFVSLCITVSGFATGARDEVFGFLGPDALWSPTTGRFGSLAVIGLASVTYGIWLTWLLRSDDRPDGATYGASLL